MTRPVNVPLEDHLPAESIHVHIKVARLHARSLLKERVPREVVRCCRHELLLVALRILRDEIAPYRAAFEKDEAVVVDVRHLAERLVHEVRRGLVLVLEHVDHDELVRDAKLLEDDRRAARGMRGRETVELDGHRAVRVRLRSEQCGTRVDWADVPVRARSLLIICMAGQGAKRLWRA